jgi:asparagine synthase (glutamine-hydrolysing)
LHRYVDRKLIERPKQGFAVPIADWLRGPLREWAEDLLSERELSESGMLNPGPIRAAWGAHLRSQCNCQHALWVVLMFQSWFRKAQPLPG